MLAKITLNLEVGDSLETSIEGVYKTELTHPQFVGTLWFVHGENDRDAILELKNESVLAGTASIVKSVMELSKSSWKKPKVNKKKQDQAPT